eukprot:TRINITY_DN5119_c0_g1_i1.p1 TRINITY_DN5119_c0_g1~~TRINITY_DN5119_c0_g1_i1.p1  ORF type:complete len:420 (+),score=93.61 TRINITY_DN5119_c0_g1_i1:143-1402(+)
MLKRVTTIGLRRFNTRDKNTISTRVGTIYLERDLSRCCRTMTSTPNKDGRSPFTIKSGLQFRYQREFRSAGIIPIAIKKITDVDKLTADLNKIQLADTSAQPNTTLNTSTDTIQNNTNTANNNNTNSEPVTPTKQLSGSTHDLDLFVLMLREARPGSPFKNNPEYQGLSFPGGKIDTKDLQDPINTALREFNEETANLFAAHLEPMKEQLSEYFPKNAVYIRSGKYYLFTTQVPDIDIEDKKFIPDKTEEKLQGLCWMKLRDLVSAINSKAAKNTLFDNKFYLHSFTQSMLETPAVISLLRLILQQFNEKKEFSLGTPKDGELQRAIVTKNVSALSTLLLRYHEGDKHGLSALLLDICDNLDADPNPSPKTPESFSQLPSEVQYHQRVSELTSPFKPFKDNNRQRSPNKHRNRRDQAKK